MLFVVCVVCCVQADESYYLFCLGLQSVLFGVCVVCCVQAYESYYLLCVGLRSVLFAINIDNADFNAIHRARGLEELMSRTAGALTSGQSAPGYVPGMHEPRPVIGSLVEDNKTGTRSRP